MVGMAIYLLDKHREKSEIIGALQMRLKNDLEAYKEKLVNPTSGQIINIEIRTKHQSEFQSYIELTNDVINAMAQQIYDLQNQNDVPALKGKIYQLESRLKKAEMVLSSGYGYNLSLLNFQQRNDFY